MSLLVANRQVDQITYGSTHEITITQTMISSRTGPFSPEPILLVESRENPSMLINAKGIARLARKRRFRLDCRWAFMGKRKYTVANPLTAKFSEILTVYEKALANHLRSGEAGARPGRT